MTLRTGLLYETGVVLFSVSKWPCFQLTPAIKLTGLEAPAGLGRRGLARGTARDQGRLGGQ